MAALFIDIQILDNNSVLYRITVAAVSELCQGTVTAV